MIRTPKRSVSVWFFVAFMMACFFIWATIQNNREIAQRRLAEPVQTVGTLVSSDCTTFLRGGRYTTQKPEAVLEYKYSTVGPNPTQHVLVTTRWFDTLEDCAAFEKSISNVATIWYEKVHPEKASLYKTEPDSWGFLYGLILAALFVLFGVYDQKSINKEKRDSQKGTRAAKRALNRLKRERKP
jgi:hypothetical protein